MTVAIAVDIDAPQKKASGRTVEWRWPTAQLDEKKTEYAVVSVSHHKAGANYFSGTRSSEDYFSASLRNETEEVGDRFTSTSFGLFKGISIGRYPAGNRYSAKKLAEAADLALAELQRRYKADDPDVMPYFSGLTD